MAALTFSDILTRVMNRVRLPTSDTTQLARVGAMLNDVIREVWGKYDWPETVKRMVVNTATPYDSGTVATTYGNALVTLTAAPTGLGSFARAAFSVSNQATDSGAVYRILTHVANEATMLLDAPYTGESNTAASYVLYQDSYSLATDCGRVRFAKRFGTTEPLRSIGYQDMIDVKGWDTTTTRPHAWTVLDYATTGDPTTAQQFMVHPYPDDVYRIEIFYTRVPEELSGTARPFIPDAWSELLVDGVLAMAYPEVMNDTERGQYFAQRYADRLNGMLVQARRHEGQFGIEPRDSYRSFYSHGRRAGGRRSSLRSLFDRWPSDP